MISSRSPGTDAESGPWLFVVDPDCDITDTYELLRNFASIYPLRRFNQGTKLSEKTLTVERLVGLPAGFNSLHTYVQVNTQSLTFPAPVLTFCTSAR